MARRKKQWKSIGSQADLDKVAVGTKIRNEKTGQEFVVMKVGDRVNGVLHIEARPIPQDVTTFAYQDGKWGFA